MKNANARGRPRGRNMNGKRLPNRNQVFDSNGPGVRLRGNAQQLVEKYLGLARDAASQGDRVLAENCNQHADHYQRVLNALSGRYTRADEPASAYNQVDEDDGDDDEDDRADTQAYIPPDPKPTPRPRPVKTRDLPRDPGSEPQPDIPFDALVPKAAGGLGESTGTGAHAGSAKPERTPRRRRRPTPASGESADNGADPSGDQVVSV